MLDTTFSAYQRSRGTARVALGRGARIETLYQSGSAKAMIPRTHGPYPEVVFLNTSGGLTGGDYLHFGLRIAEGETAIAATQTAERAYASPGGAPARVEINLNVDDCATLYWLPQETILFDRAALSRKTNVHLGRRARFVGVETVVLGRAHMGEQVERLDFNDARRVFDARGKPRHVEQITLDESVLQDRCAPVSLGGSTVFSTVTYIAEDAADRLSAVRCRLKGDPELMAASAWDNRLVIRAMGDDAWAVRAALIPVLRLLTEGPLPRVWQL